MYAVIGNLELFYTSVFGADSFIEYWPKLLTSGVPVVWGNNGKMLYVVNYHGERTNNTAFFTREEVKCLALFQ